MIKIIKGYLRFDWELTCNQYQLLSRSKIAEWLINKNGDQDSIDWYNKKHNISDYRIDLNSKDLTALILTYPEYFTRKYSK